MNRTTLSLHARLVFPVGSPPLYDAAVTVAGDRIVAVGPAPANAERIDLGNVAIVPGLVNAHTHLEFSHLAAPLGTPGMRFPDWIREVIQHRRAAGDGASSTDATRRGLAESLAAGVTTVGEIATAGWSAETFGDSPATAVVFRELLGLAADRRESLLQTAQEHVAVPATDRLLRGLSPHAPYTVSPDVVAAVCRLSAERSVPVAMHLAETVEELELLASHSGPFHEFLTEIGAWSAAAIPRGIQPLDYLRMLCESRRALVIHGNYLSDTEIDFLAEHAARMSLVYCPRTHAYFGHARYPLAELLARGVHVAIGTDSRASNPDLDLLAELRFVARQHPEVSGEQILQLGTRAGAAALGFADRGVLVPGMRADLALIRLPDRDDDPHAMLLDSAEPVVGVWPADRDRLLSQAGKLS